MAVFLKVLSIIGLVLLGILALVVFLLLLVLFVPVRYKADGSFKDNRLSAKAKASWLLHILSFSYVYGKEEPVAIRVFGIRLRKKMKKEKSFEEDDSLEPKKEKDLKETKEEKEDPEKSDIESTKPDSNEKSVESPLSEDYEEDYEEHFEEVSDKSSDKKKSVKDKKVSNKDNICDKIKKYIEIIKSEKFQKTYSYAKEKIKKLLKHILPRKWEINALLGFDDPSVTGNILVYSSVLYPFIAKHIHVYGDFNNQVIDVDAYAKGRITVFKALLIGAQLYFYKDIKRVLKMFEEV